MTGGPPLSTAATCSQCWFNEAHADKWQEGTEDETVGGGQRREMLGGGGGDKSTEAVQCV